MEELELAIAKITEDSDYEEIDALKINFANQIDLLSNVLETEESGQIAEEDADIAIAQIIENHAQAQLDAFDLEVEVEFENEAQFNFNTVGAMLAALIDSDYTDEADAVVNISKVTGLCVSEIEEIIEDRAVPDHATADAIATVFPTLQQDEVAYKTWIELVSLTLQAKDGAEIAKMDGAESSLRAEFNALKEQHQLIEELRLAENKANQLVDAHLLTPFEKKILLGNFADAEDRLALFSAACEEAAVPLDTQLDRINYYLYIASQRGEVKMFEPMVQEANFSAADPEADKYAIEYIDRNGYPC
jgi:hypothetical protein